MPINSEEVKKLREMTGVGIMTAKAALVEANGKMEKAIVLLRKKGEAKAAKRAGRQTTAGLVDAYVHQSRVGALVEVDCETDFVARTDDFKDFVHDVAMQVAATQAEYLNPADVPAKVVEKEKEIFTAEAVKDGKPPQAVAKIVEGKLQKFYQEVCLLKQPCIKNPERDVEGAMHDLISKMGENIVIKRFARYQLGEGSE